MWKFKLLLALLIPGLAYSQVTLRHCEQWLGSFNNPSTSDSITLTTTLNDTSKAFITYGSRSTQQDPGKYLTTCALTNTTTVTCNRQASGGSVSILGYVCEFTSGVTVDRGELTVLGWDGGGGGCKTATLSNVTDIDEAFLLAGQRHTGTAFNSDDTFYAWLFDDSGTLKVKACTDSTSNNTDAVTWQAIQVAGGVAQRGNTSMTSSETSKTVTISTIDVNRSHLQVHWSSDVSGATLNGWAIEGFINSATQIEMQRNATLSQAIHEIRWEVFDWPSGVDSEQIKFDFPNNDGFEAHTLTNTLSATSNSVPLGSSVLEWGQCDNSSNDEKGVCSTTADLTSTTSVDFQRGDGSGVLSTTFYILDFAGSTDPPVGGAVRMLSLTGAGT